MTSALELRGIHKQFGSVQALRGADFLLRSGELHALLGENGAGKTTLMQIAAGLVAADQGSMLVNGREVAVHNPRQSQDLGIGMVHQHSSSIPAFSVVENVALAAGWSLNPTAMRSRIDQLNDEFGFTLDPHERADTLSVVGLQQLEILKVLATGASILLLDEPTGSLAPGQARDFLLLVRKLVERRRSVVLITHKLDDALNHADTITVLKQGRVTWSQDAKEYDEETLATAMLGRQPPTVFLTPNVVGKVVVQAADLEVRPLRGKGPGLTSATFEVRAGETIGVAAVEGNGERELLWSVAGLLPPVRGRLNVQGPATLIPEDRATGLIPDFTLIDNLTLGLGEKSPWVHRGIIYPGRAYEGGAEILTRHGVLAPGPHTRAGWLSGGNQQKLMLARALESKPRVILAENPGRGLDLRASHTAFEQFRKAAHDGAAVLIHSSDLEELLEWCDRIVVVAGGKVYHPAEKTQASIGRLMVATGTS